MNGHPGVAQTAAPGCPVVPENFESDPDCVSRTAGRVAPADRRGFPLELAPTSPPSVGASPPRKHAHRPPDATSFFFARASFGNTGMFRAAQPKRKMVAAMRPTETPHSNALGW